MIPDSIGAVIAFMLLIAPGMVWERHAGRRIPEQKQTALREVSQIVLGSLTASSIAAVLLFWVWIPALAHQDDSIILLGAAGATCLLACGLVSLFAWWKLKGPARITDGSVWHKAFEDWVSDPESSGPYLTATLEDGTVWRGDYGAFDAGPEDADPLLCLKEPLSRRKAGDGERFVRYESGQVVLLPTRQIISVRVSYTQNSSREQESHRP